MNLQEVARAARVSTATVSRVLNNVGPVKASTRARVLKAISDLKYHPNLLARNLAGGKSRTLGMIVSNMENPFFFDIYRAAEEEARTVGFEILLANTDYKPDRLAKNIRLMLGRRVAGLALVISEIDDTLIQELSDSDIPVVFYDVGTARDNVSNIVVRYSKGVDRVVHYLHELGHRRIGFLSHHSVLGPVSVREVTFTEAVGRCFPQVECKVVASADSIEGGRRAAREIVNSGLDATAIVCVNDFMALGVLHELREMGIRVPDDVSVTGFDNIKLGEVACPPLTTVHIPRERIGRLMFEALSVPASTAAEPSGRLMVIDPEFVVRGSTATARS